MLIRSTIHEYTHTLQSLKEYSLMNKQVGYDNNPFEVEANESEKKHYKECWSEIKKHYKKW
jgi:chloramphenicol O-acetyltransferase